jgi:hypothetical protein
MITVCEVVDRELQMGVSVFFGRDWFAWRAVVLDRRCDGWGLPPSSAQKSSRKFAYAAAARAI